MISRILSMVLTGALLLAPAMVSAWDATASISGALPADFFPQAMTAADSHGYWALTSDAASPLLVRYSSAGDPQFVRYVQNEFYPSYIALAAMPDGGALVSDTDGFNPVTCVFRRYDEAGNLRWTNAHIPQGYSAAHGEACDPFAVDGSGGIWLNAEGSFYRIAPDGSVGVAIQSDGMSIEAFVGDPHGANVFFAGSVGGSGQTRAAIRKINASGVEVWTWQAPSSDSGSNLDAIVVGSDGALQAYGTLGEFPAYTFYAASVTTAGVTRWTHGYPDLPVVEVHDVAAAQLGASYVLLYRPTSGGSYSVVLDRITSGGTIAWSNVVDTTDSSGYCAASAVRAAPASGDAAVVSICANGFNTTNLARFSDAGGKLFAKAIPLASYNDLQVLPDDSSLLLLMPAPIQLPDGGGIQITPPLFERDSAAGSTLPPPVSHSIVAALDTLRLQTFAPDGSAFLLSSNDTSGLSSLIRTAPDGSVVWRQGVSGEWNNVGAPATLALAGNSICLVGSDETDEVANCYSAASGQPQIPVVLATAIGSSNLTFARAIASGAVVTLYSGGNGQTHHALFNPGGAVLHDVTPLIGTETPGRPSFNASGDCLLLTSATSYVRLAADGSRRYSQTLSADSGTLLQTYLVDDGTGLLLISKNNEVELARIDATGTILWKEPTPVLADGAYRSYASSVRVSGGNAYLALTFRGLVYGTAGARSLPSVVFKVALADGAVAWSASVPAVMFEFVQLQLDANAGSLLAVSGWVNRIHLQTLDTADGTAVAERFEACAADSCALSAANLGNDGVLRVLVDTSSDQSGNWRQLYVNDNPFAAAVPIRIDQPGLDGAWLAPYSGGQGFTLDYIASASTIFMPWFTFAPGGTNDPAGLAWFALQGSVAAGATSADLAIAIGNPGAFNTGSVPGRQVGTAHLSFTDCNSGTLLYQFDADTNGGASGLITLARLTPSTDPCTLADGSGVPAQNTNPPQQGFDARQSGSWFDPATGGQGLELTVIPPGSGSAGVIFIPWFTFDPAGKADDAASQHWFTLQGDLAAAANGKVVLPIYRIIGGAIDGLPTQNFAQVGHATLTMKGCDTAQLDYQFDMSEVAHAFSGLAGSSHLIKIGGCNTP